MRSTNHGLNNVETIFWWLYLLGIIALSFITGRIDSIAWLWTSTLFFGYLTLYLLAIALNKIQVNHRALHQAKVGILFLFAGLCWLLLQIIIPADESRLLGGLHLETYAAWFSKQGVISVTPHKTLVLAYSWLIVACLFVLTLSIVRKRQQLKQLLVVLIIIGIGQACIGIAAQQASIFLVDIQQLDGHFLEARGWFVNRNHFAAFLILVAAGGLSVLFKRLLQSGERAPFNWRKPGASEFMCLLALLQLVLIFSAVFLSHSRAAFIGFAVMLLFTTIMALRKNERSGITLTALGLGLGLVVILVLNSNLGVAERIRNGAFVLGERVMQWNITWQAILEAPLAGYGGGSYGTVFQAFRQFAPLRQVYFNQAHNDYLHLWLEQGIIGLGLWVGFLTVVATFALRSIRVEKSSLAKGVIIASLITCFAAVGQAVVDFNLQILNIRCFFIVLTALIFIAPSIHQRPNHLQLKRRSGSA